MILDPKFTINEMIIECRKRIDELTCELMVKVREEQTEAEPNQQAVKNVLTNCGPEAERWDFTEHRGHSVDDPLMSIIQEIGQQGGVKLPGQENE